MSLTFSVEDALGVIVIDRQAKLNALDLESFRELVSFVATLEKERGVRGLIIAAAGGRAFSAGADISDLVGIDAKEASDRARYRRNALQRLAELPIPSVAVIDGLALGGGAELALACTFRLATARSSFSFPEIALGLLPGAGGTQRLPRLIGESRALDLILTGRRVDAAEALRIGLIDRMIEDPMRDARAFASQWLNFSRLAIQAALAAVRSASRPIEGGLLEEGVQLDRLSTSADATEGVAAFFEKRAPIFNRG